MQVETPTLELDAVLERVDDAVLAEMLPVSESVEPEPASEAAAAISDPALALAIVELELALDTAQANRTGFSEAVGDAAKSIGGDFLFALPAAGLAKEYQKVAAVRLPGGTSDRRASLAFVLLSEDGTAITVQPPNERTDGLARFANAFIEVLERF